MQVIEDEDTLIITGGLRCVVMPQAKDYPLIAQAAEQELISDLELAALLTQIDIELSQSKTPTKDYLTDEEFSKLEKIFSRPESPPYY